MPLFARHWVAPLEYSMHVGEVTSTNVTVGTEMIHLSRRSRLPKGCDRLLELCAQSRAGTVSRTVIKRVVLETRKNTQMEHEHEQAIASRLGD